MCRRSWGTGTKRWRHMERRRSRGPWRGGLAALCGFLLLRAGDVAGYRKFCQRIADHADDKDAAAAAQAAWTCVLAPEALSVQKRTEIAPQAEKLWAAQPRSHKALTILGAALLRAGELQPAGEKLLAALKAGGEDVDIADELFLAILLEKQAKGAAAGNLLADAQAPSPSARRQGRRPDLPGA